MSFKEALNKLIHEYGIEILNDKFKTRSFSCDCVGSNYYENRLIENFILINCIFDLVVTTNFNHPYIFGFKTTLKSIKC